MKRRGWLGLALSAALAACAGSGDDRAEAQPAPKPGLWKLADDDTTIYLFGTIHVLPKGFEWRTPKIEAVIKAADSLVLEVADSDDPAKTAKTFTSLAISPGLPPVADRVPPENRATLGMLIDKVGISERALQDFESWAVAITLAAGMLSDLGVSPDDGVERQLTADFKAMKKPVAGLESTAEQLGFFDKLSESSQRAFLLSMVEEAADAKGEFKKMTDAWVSGDDRAIAITFDDEVKLSPELTDALIRKRNARWTEWLVKRLETPGTILVAVGAGHLAGPDSVQMMLAKNGLNVIRIQ